MFNLVFRTHNSNLINTLRIQLRNPKFHIPISRFRSPKETLVSNPAIKFILDEVEERESSGATGAATTQFQTEIDGLSRRGGPDGDLLPISHPWPEWVELMENLLKRGYFEGIGNPFQINELGAKYSNLVRTACLNFARDQPDLMRYLSRKDIMVVAASGCPSVDRKVVNSGKRLRANVGIDEGNVCSSCILRGSCERAYAKAGEEEGGRTIDVIRFLLIYGLDPVTGSVENKPCLNRKVKDSLRKLMKEIVDFSNKEGDSNPPRTDSFSEEKSTQRAQGQSNAQMKQGDWICPNCNFLNFARNIKCLRCDGLFKERLIRLRADQDNLPLKKGDWICDTCNSLNFANNTRCFLCKEKPPKRQLNPGEWECESCNYINFRKNMVCLKCDHRRPKALNLSGSTLDDNGGQRQTELYNRKQKSWGDKGVDLWDFVEDENGDDDEVSGFFDFPIVGGKSNFSRDQENQEKWRNKMMEKSRKIGKAKWEDDEFRSSVKQKSFEFLNPTDTDDDEDEEMNEWFGPRERPEVENSIFGP